MKNRSMVIRLFGLLLALTLALSLFAGCKKDETVASSKPAESSEASSKPPVEVVEEYQEKEDPHLPETADLGGKAITFAVLSGDEAYLIPKEGDSAEGDLVLETLRKTQTKYNCTVETIPVKLGDWSGSIMTSILSGDKFADVLLPCVHQAGQYVSARLCSDFLNKEISRYIHLEEPWWNDTMAYASNVGGCVYAGACNIESTADATFIIYFNKRILKEIGSSDTELYKMYKDKTWTWDVFRALAKKAIKDKNNDGKMDATDQWGFVGPSYDSVEAFLSSAYLGSIVTDNGKNPTYNYTTPFAITTLQTLNDLYTLDGSYCQASSGTNDAPTGRRLNRQMFIDGLALFLSNTLAFVTDEGTRAMEDDYGIMPVPLGPTADGGWQTEYATRVSHNKHIALIPVTNDNLADTALVLESIAFDYWKIINQKVETYGSLYLADDDSAYIATQIYNYASFEISQFLYTTNGGDYKSAVIHRVDAVTRNPAYDVASQFASVAELAQGIIDTYFKGN